MGDERKDRHTPGPWEAEWAIRRDIGQEKQWGIFAPDLDTHGPIADLSESDDFREPAEVAANARLIAAAPDLLAACRAFVSTYEDQDFDDEEEFGPECNYTEDEVAAMNAARAAIAKATGTATQGDTSPPVG